MYLAYQVSELHRFWIVYLTDRIRSELSQQDMKNLIAPELGILEAVSQSELKDILHRVLGRLKARERRAIELWMEGMSSRAIANELKTTVGAVKMLKFRAILKLKKMMTEYCHEV